MDNKTNSGKLVRKYIGEEIEKFKFEYKGYQNDSWKYERKFKGVIQTISIYPYRFDQRMITFELYTDVKNSAYASEMGTNVIQAGMIEDITTNSEMRGYWKYDTEDELIEVLNDMKDVLMKKGMRILVQLSKGEEETDTAEMYHELYFNHDELCEKFIKKTGIKATGFDEKNINNWFEVIEERVAVFKKQSYEQSKWELVEMAAFLGNQLVKYLDGEWYHFVSKDHESCSIINCNTAYSCTNCLKVLVGGYTKNGMDWVKEIFLERCKKKIVKNSYNISKM